MSSIITIVRGKAYLVTARLFFFSPPPSLVGTSFVCARRAISCGVRWDCRRQTVWFLLSAQSGLDLCANIWKLERYSTRGRREKVTNFTTSKATCRVLMYLRWMSAHMTARKQARGPFSFLTHYFGKPAVSWTPYMHVLIWSNVFGFAAKTSGRGRPCDIVWIQHVLKCIHIVFSSCCWGRGGTGSIGRGEQLTPSSFPQEINSPEIIRSCIWEQGPTRCTELFF